LQASEPCGHAMLARSCSEEVRRRLRLGPFEHEASSDSAWRGVGLAEQEEMRLAMLRNTEPLRGRKRATPFRLLLTGRAGRRFPKKVPSGQDEGDEED
jgi:hypothetical protein